MATKYVQASEHWSHEGAGGIWYTAAIGGVVTTKPAAGDTADLNGLNVYLDEAPAANVTIIDGVGGGEFVIDGMDITLTGNLTFDAGECDCNNHKLIIPAGATVLCTNGGIMRVNAGGTLQIETGGKLQITASGLMVVYDDGILILPFDGQFVVAGVGATAEVGAQLDWSGLAVEVKNAVLTFAAGSYGVILPEQNEVLNSVVFGQLGALAAGGLAAGPLTVRPD